jgi:hypothetical protein
MGTNATADFASALVFAGSYGLREERFLKPREVSFKVTDGVDTPFLGDIPVLRP